MAFCLLSLGANLGDRTANIQAAFEHLNALPNSCLIATSQQHPTFSIGGPIGQPDFLNSAAILETTLSPNALLDGLLQIEQQLGRVRTERWGPRSIDLDLLLYENVIVHNNRLSVPHPRLAVRSFALAPAAEIAPQWVHPEIGWTLIQLLTHLQSAPNYLALCGLPGTGKTRVANGLVREISGKFISLDVLKLREELSGANSDIDETDFELTLLHRRRDLIQSGVAAAGIALNDSWLISDFWLNQALAYGATYTPATIERVRTELHTISAATISPKLRILLSWPDSSHDSAGLQGSLKTLAKQTGIGPILELDASDVEVVQSEALAALQAMRPSVHQ